jgi:type I restriction enzyme S subunit
VDKLGANTEQNSLPQGWAMATLGQLGSYTNGRGFKRTEWSNQGFPIIRIQNLTGSGTKFNYYSGSLDEKHRVRPGDLLISWSATLDAYVWNGSECALNQHIYKVEPFIDKFYLFYCVKNFLRTLVQQVHGTGMQHITNARFMNTMVPVAPLAEQKRIVAKIEALFAESKTMRDALSKVPVLLRRFRQSVLAKAFRGDLTQRNPDDEPAQRLLERIKEERKREKQNVTTENKTEYSADLPELPEPWIWTTIGELETFVGSGITPGGGKKVYHSEGIPFIRSQNVYPDGLHLGNVAHVTREMHAEMKRTQVHPNDVLLNITGASIGRSAYIPKEFGEANVNQHVCIIRTGWWIVPAYLSHFLNSPYSQDQIFSTESGVTREGLNYTQVRSLQIPLAPLEEQKRIASRIEEAFPITNRVEAAAAKARERAGRINQAILAKAFRGEIVPQDPGDEPASALLQRIKAGTVKQTSFKGN